MTRDGCEKCAGGVVQHPFNQVLYLSKYVCTTEICTRKQRISTQFELSGLVPMYVGIQDTACFNNKKQQITEQEPKGKNKLDFFVSCMHCIINMYVPVGYVH